MRAVVHLMQQLSAAVSRDGVVFATSMLLLGAGLIPGCEVLYRVQSASSASEKLTALAALTPLDKATIAGSALVAVLGFAVLAAHVLTLRSKQTSRMWGALGLMLVLTTLASTVLLAEIGAQQKPESVWHDSVFTQREDVFEARVNDVYCHVKGAQVCQIASLGEAKQVFPLESWPVGMASQPGKTVLTTCERFDESVRLWDYPAKMELCRVCHTITQDEQRGGDELLDVVDDISFQELQWCGAYLVNDERKMKGYDDVSESPYRKHRHAFQQLLAQSQPMYTLTLGTRVLFVLISAAIACLVALFGSSRRNSSQSKSVDVESVESDKIVV
ncbi:hypothetical protein FI667_g4491, partial [Globisporangium splendens]